MRSSPILFCLTIAAFAVVGGGGKSVKPWKDAIATPTKQRRAWAAEYIGGDGTKTSGWLLAKERRVLAKDLGEDSKLFVGHIPDIDDVGIFHPIPVPPDFEAYDNWPKDGQISLNELVKVTGATENVEESFHAADKNGDEAISRSEFRKAPWWLEIVDEASAVSLEETLPSGDEFSWSYILNGNLQRQQKSSVADETLVFRQGDDVEKSPSILGQQMNTGLSDQLEDQDNFLLTQ